VPIGNPIPYDDYIRNGKNNADGDNLVPAQKPAKPPAKVEGKAMRDQRSYSS
jgi:hypothetical protein